MNTYSKTRSHRRGLAPLEMVLFLPILLFVAALMVNLGTMTVWRLRGEIVSRDAAWRTRWPRSGGEEPRPVRRVWPDDADMAVVAEEDVDQIEKLNDPAINHAVARGPLPNDFIVNDHLKPDRGAHRGSSEINRRFPLLPRLGRYESGDIEHLLLDKRWSVTELGIPANVYRRTLTLYEMPKTDPGLPEAFLNAVMDLLDMPLYAALYVLDRDPDVSRDFHPRINRNMVSTSVSEVRETEVERLIDTLDEVRDEVRLGEISRLPRTMTNAYLSAYNARLQSLQDIVSDPESTPAERSAAQAEIPIIEEYIAQLEMYRGRLREIEESLEDRFRATL